jgi:AcrR family transcriptional regulator
VRAPDAVATPHAGFATRGPGLRETDGMRDGDTPRQAELLRHAAEILEHDGLEALSLGAIARRAGIATPSIYKHFPSRRAIELRLIEDGFRDFGAAVGRALAAADGTTRGRVAAFAAAYRADGLRHPARYRLMTDGPLPRAELDPAAEQDGQRELFELIPDEHVARSAWAWAHGLLSLELAGRYPPGADVDAAWDVLVDGIVALLDARGGGASA